MRGHFHQVQMIGLTRTDAVAHRNVRVVLTTRESAPPAAALGACGCVYCGYRWYPPLFTVLACAAQVACFYASASDALTRARPAELAMKVPLPATEVYRIFSNMLAHMSPLHLWSNVFCTVVLGGVFEAFHGFLRIGIVWYGAAVVGTLIQAQLVFPNPTTIAGSSGGVYGLWMAYVGFLVINWSEVRFRRLLFLTGVVPIVVEGVLAFTDPDPGIAYGAHFSGAVFGGLCSVLVVKNFRWYPHERVIITLSAVIVSGALLALAASTPRLVVSLGPS